MTLGPGTWFWNRWDQGRSLEGGLVSIDDDGLAFDVEDDYYSGRLSREDAVALAKVILARFTGATFRREPE